MSKASQMKRKRRKRKRRIWENWRMFVMRRIQGEDVVG